MNLLNPLHLHCQNNAVQDSVILVKNGDGTVAYLFPRRIAIEYLHLRKDVVPQAISLIDSLNLVVLKQDTVKDTFASQLVYCNNIISNDSLAIAQLNTTLENNEATLKKQKRKIMWWKLSAMGSGILGAVLGYVIGQAGS